ncbi:MAG: NAD(P)-binding domain-containing protein [bacterium]
MADQQLISILVYVSLGVIIIWFITRLSKKTEQTTIHQLTENTASGLNEPPTLHPVIDPALCMGCGSCVKACPEGKILGLIDNKAQLINGSACIGHGQCKLACPFDAINLVFGTAQRGIEIPEINAEFETNVPRIFIAGELGGMGLIKNAIEQGRQAITSIVKHYSNKPSHLKYDLIIVGAGPAGLSAAIHAKQKNLNAIILEQDKLGGTIAHFPRGKIVMTQPATLPGIGVFQFREASKEKMMQFWTSAVSKLKLNIREQTTVTAIKAESDRIKVQSKQGELEASALLLACGRRGTPRKLGIEGEELSKVMYRLDDPAQYQNKHLLIVGGGDAALEAAISLEEAGAIVTLSYRSSAFSRAKAKNRAHIEQIYSKISVLMCSQLKKIDAGFVLIEHKEQLHKFKNDYVIICAGGIPPSGFLKEIGIEMTMHYGQ